MSFLNSRKIAPERNRSLPRRRFWRQLGCQSGVFVKQRTLVQVVRYRTFFNQWLRHKCSTPMTCSTAVENARFTRSVSGNRLILGRFPFLRGLCRKVFLLTLAMARREYVSKCGVLWRAEWLSRSKARNSQRM